MSDPTQTPAIQPWQPYTHQECAQQKPNLELLGKSVYILRGQTPTNPMFCGLIAVDDIEEGSGPTVCFYLHGCLMTEEGEIFNEPADNLRVRVAILENTFILYRNL